MVTVHQLPIDNRMSTMLHQLLKLQQTGPCVRDNIFVVAFIGLCMGIFAQHAPAGSALSENQAEKTLTPWPTAVKDGYGGIDGLSQADLFYRAAEAAGLTPEQLSFRKREVALWGGDRYRLPIFDLYFHDTFIASPLTRIYARQARNAAPRPGNISYLAQSWTGHRVRDNPYGSWANDIVARVDELGDLALANAIVEIGLEAGDTSVDEVADLPGYSDIPNEVARVAAIILMLTPDAMAYREMGLIAPLDRLGLNHEAVWNMMYRQLFWEEEGDRALTEIARETLTLEQILDHVDFLTFYKGANTVLMGLDRAVDTFTGETARQLEVAKIREQEQAGAMSPEEVAAAIAATTAPDVISDLQEAEFSFIADTKLGRIELNGAGSHTYNGPADGVHHLLIIDTGGDDVYVQAGVADSFFFGLGIAIDLAGNDRYESADAAAWQAGNAEEHTEENPFEHARPEDHAPAFGAGICGYGYVLDFRGNDTYTTPFGGQGASVLGFGLLWDAEGNDRYSGDRGVQGSATFGAAVLADLQGDDRYHAYCAAQGYGYTLGSGLLIDTEGDDLYLSETDDVKYRWFGTHPEQLNLSQGFGFGRRADYGDGHSWAGGVGSIFDFGEGNDTYHADIFAIGSAYWYALGMAYDDGGNDDYTSYAYSIASPPHFAVGVVINESGNDTYRGASSRVCGFGRDFSIGWFEDAAGDDTYLANDSGFGVGNVNGIGVFWDHRGDDTYVAFANSFGTVFVESAGSQRDIFTNFGLFVDGGGNDDYLQMTGEVRETFTEDLGRMKRAFRLTDDMRSTFGPYRDAHSAGVYEYDRLRNNFTLSRDAILPQASATGGFIDAESSAPMTTGR